MKRPPKLCRNKFNNTAYITVKGKQNYLEKWGSEEIKSSYERFLLNWVKADGETKKENPHKGYAVTEIAVAFIAHYRERPVKSSSDIQTFTRIADRLGTLFPGCQAENFRIRELEILRDSFQKEEFIRRGKQQKRSRT